MALHPVIMCGGSGSRLWPVSRPDRPKQFIPLVGERSSFQETALRVAGLAGAASPVVIAGLRHREIIEAQLAEIGLQAMLLLEPEGRDSAPAIAAAAAWIASRDPEGVAVIVSADHYIPDPAAFAAAIARTLAPARAGRIVTLGVRPSEPSTAYGYIRPGKAKASVKPVEAFVEKPAADLARRYVAQGYLWNSGNFVARAATVLAELEAHAPQVAKAARLAVAEAAGEGAVRELSEAFRAAPRTSIDYAVMEKTGRACVLPVDFIWSDIGAWDAVWAVSAKDSDRNSLSFGARTPGSEEVLVKAPAGVQVAVVGVSRIAVIVEPNAVLVTSLDSAQAVKDIAAHGASAVPPAPFATLAGARAWYANWLATAALPVWATLGVDPDTGGFREGLKLDGAPHDPYRRGRVQARQVFVFARAAQLGIPGPWREVARRGFAAYAASFARPDGLFAIRCELTGAISDARVCLYEQAFTLLALCALFEAQVEPDAMLARAERLLAALAGHRHPAGGFRERDEHPFQSNAHMHLFEAALAWEQAGGGARWSALADELASLAIERFVDPQGGFLREFFDAAWRPAAGDDGRWVEPGHQFEWAWLLQRWWRARARPGTFETARKLFATGVRGVDRAREVAVNVLWDDLALRDGSARLWPQTEHLKAALAMGDEAEALSAARGLARYLDVPLRGAWRDRMRPDGGFEEAPAPASSLYHLAMAVFELAPRAAGA